MIIYTSICANYLPKAMALAHSVKQHIPDATFVVCLSERTVHTAAANCNNFDHVYLAHEIGLNTFESFMFRHSIVEASTAVKAQMLKFLMETYQDQDKFIYLDPDIVVYSDFVELRALLDENSIIIAPHLLFPGNIDMEISSLAHGCYNLGFLAVSRTKNAETFVQWWADRLYSFCYDDKKRGLFTDQRWIDLVPCFFDVHILKHHGYDFATWSLLDSDLQRTEKGYEINGDPLRFIHFSGIDGGTIDMAVRNWLRQDNREIFVQLYTEYKKMLDEFGQEILGKISWSYNTYSSGEKIDLSAREMYRQQTLEERFPDPFTLSNKDFTPQHEEQRYTLFALFGKTIKSIKDDGFTVALRKIVGYGHKHFGKR